MCIVLVKQFFQVNSVESSMFEMSVSTAPYAQHFLLPKLLCVHQDSPEAVAARCQANNIVHII